MSEHTRRQPAEVEDAYMRALSEHTHLEGTSFMNDPMFVNGTLGLRTIASRLHLPNVHALIEGAREYGEHLSDRNGSHSVLDPHPEVESL